MNPKLMEFIAKFADNAHLGKLTTDLAPGVILTVTILLLLASFTPLNVFPYACREEHQKQLEEAKNDVKALDAQLCSLEDQLAKCRAELDNLKLADEAGQLKKVDLDVLGKKAEAVRKERDARQAELKELAAEAKDPFSLKANLDVLGEHFGALFIVGYFLGAMLAQVSGKLFYNGTFNKHFRNRYRVPYDILSSKDHRTMTYYQTRITGDAFLKRLPNLEADYYRYLEVAMNMILPFLALSVTLLAIGISRIWCNDRSSMILVLVLAAIGFALSRLLYLNARVLYVGYFMKKADIMELLQEENPRPIPERGVAAPDS